MRRYLLPGVAVVVAVLLLALLAFGVSHQGTSNSIDAQLARGKQPAVPKATLALPVLGGRGTESIAQLRGKVVLLNVFAGWCTSCIGEAPLLEHEQQVLLEHGGTVLGVTYDDDSDDAEQFMHTYHLTYPVIRDVDSRLVPALQSTGVPETFVIDRQGRIVAHQPGPVDQAWLTQTVAPLLGTRS